MDPSFMQLALDLARATVGLTSPNPQVGCVLVRDGQVLGAGAHLYDQVDHAEIVTLKQARAAGYDPRDATAYVTLEPCSHHGRTGPCADALVAAGIARCVVATSDPNPAVSGRGLARLRAAGIDVRVGVLEAEAREINFAFACSITLERPCVTIKAALSVDGLLAPPPAQRLHTAPFFLTGLESRAEVQQLRHACDAVLSGIGTVLADDPQLTDRTGLPRRRPLMRVILDSSLRTARTSRLLNPSNQDVWFFCSAEASLDRATSLENAGAMVTRVASHGAGLDLHAILAHLHQASIRSVLLEAGSELNGAFLRQHLVDRAILYYAEAELGSGAVPFARDYPGPFALEQSIKDVQKRQVGADVCVSGLLRDPWTTSTGNPTPNPLAII